MREIINMVLDLNNPVADRERVVLESHDFNRWTGNVTDDFRGEFDNKGIELVLEPDPLLGNVWFDAAKSKIVLSNLLMNALKFSLEGTRVTVRTSVVEGFVRVMVEDHGIGLKHVDPEKLFTRFYRADADFNGSGIGLSYSKTLIEKCGGRIGAFDNGSGATFWFNIPLGQPHEGESGEEGQSRQFGECSGKEAVPPAVVVSDMSHYSILVAEDNTDFNIFLVDSLKGVFGEIYSACDGVEALTLIYSRQPDIVVSDVMMPRMNGYELCRRIKSEIEISHIPVVLLTARSDTESTLTGYKMGADAYIAKPFDFEMFLQLLSNVLTGRELARQRARSETTLPSPDQMTISGTDEKFLSRLNEIINDNMGEPGMDVLFLTDKMAVSRATLYNKVKAITGMGVNDYVNRLRIERAIDLLLHTDQTITEISDNLGFAYQRYFSTLFKRATGMTPSQYREQHGKVER